MKTLWKYLKDQGGQFWGAFSQSLAQAAERERDRPLKEAMMKAELGQRQAQMQKMIFDVNQAKEQAAAIDELTRVLQPKKVSAPGPASLPNEAAGEPSMPGAPIETMQTPQLTDPAVRAALLKTGVGRGQVLDQLAKASFPSGTANLAGGAIVNSWDEARRLQNDPEFQAANPYGGRWIVNAKGQIQFQGIHPVNPEAALFHGPGGQSAAIDYAYNRAGSASAGGYAGRTAQEIQQPIPQRVPFAGQPAPAPQTGGWQGNTYIPPGYQQAPAPQPAPNVGTPAQVPTSSTAPKPGETPEATKQRIRKEAQVGATPLPEKAQDQQLASAKITAQADALLKMFSPEEVDKFAGVFNEPIQTGKTYLQAGAKALGMKGPVDQAERDRFSAWQSQLAQFRQIVFDVGGKQLTPFEASVVRGYVPWGNEPNGGTEVRQKIEAMKTFLKAGAAVRLRLAREGRAEVSPEELNTIMQQELSPLVESLRSQQAPQSQSQQENIIHHPEGDFVIRNGVPFRVRKK